MKVEIKEIAHKGKGIFATKDIAASEHILDITGEIIETEHPERYPEHIREHWGPIGKEGKMYRFIMPESPWMYMNHSCDSNAGIYNDRELVAAKNIMKGEEITIDYSSLDIEAITYGKQQLEMKCECGSTRCRKVIKSFEQLSTEDQERLKPFLNKTMKKKYL